MKTRAAVFPGSTSFGPKIQEGCLLLTYLVFFCFSLLSLQANAASQLSKIVPFSCALIVSKTSTASSYRHQCSGVMVSPTKFVTAAHCFDNPSIREAMAKKQLFIACPSQRRLTVRESLVSPQYKGCAGATTYDSDYANDVAVVLTSLSGLREFPKLVESFDDFKKIATVNACAFVGYGPAVCDPKSSRFPKGCLRDVDMRTLRGETKPYFSTEADIREGDSGSGLICFGKDQTAHLVGTNVGSIYTGKVNMQSMSVAHQKAFLMHALEIPDATFIKEAASTARNHSKTCHD